MRRWRTGVAGFHVGYYKYYTCDPTITWCTRRLSAWAFKLGFGPWANATRRESESCETQFQSKRQTGRIQNTGRGESRLGEPELFKKVFDITSTCRRLTLAHFGGRWVNFVAYDALKAESINESNFSQLLWAIDHPMEGHIKQDTPWG